MGRGVWLYKEQVGHLLTISLACCHVMEKSFVIVVVVVLFVCLVFGFSRQGFSVALELVLELALIDQAGLKLTEIHLSLPPECWD